MNYEQKYKEALERARDMMSYKEVRREDMEYLFPELKESEGEKIRKQIISFLKEFEYDHYRSLDFSSWIAWLEKQGGQKLYVNDNAKEMFIRALERVEEQNSKGYKLTDCDKNSWWKDFKTYAFEQKLTNTDFKAKDWYVSKVDGKIHNLYTDTGFKPKFKVGDWLVENHPNSYARFIQILEIVDVQGRKRYRISRDIHNDEDVVECGFIENNWHLFNIQDAKDGDVLACKNGWTCIFKCLNDNVFSSHCFMDSGGWFCENGGQAHTLEKSINIHPATKEQRDLLFQKMKEEGYEWNTDEKVLNKVIIYE